MSCTKLDSILAPVFPASVVMRAQTRKLHQIVGLSDTFMTLKDPFESSLSSAVASNPPNSLLKADGAESVDSK